MKNGSKGYWIWVVLGLLVSSLACAGSALASGSDDRSYSGRLVNASGQSVEVKVYVHTTYPSGGSGYVSDISVVNEVTGQTQDFSGVPTERLRDGGSQSYSGELVTGKDDAKTRDVRLDFPGGCMGSPTFKGTQN